MPLAQINKRGPPRGRSGPRCPKETHNLLMPVAPLRGRSCSQSPPKNSDPFIDTSRQIQEGGRPPRGRSCSYINFIDAS